MCLSNGLLVEWGEVHCPTGVAICSVSQDHQVTPDRGFKDLFKYTHLNIVEDVLMRLFFIVQGDRDRFVVHNRDGVRVHMKA